MQQIHNELEINSFILSSSSEVFGVVEKVCKIDSDNVIIHISSYIHNTVLVQTLKKEIIKFFPNVGITLLKHKDKTNTKLTIFSVKSDDEIDLKDLILNKMYSKVLAQEDNIQGYRDQLFTHYFNDNLTNLPNVYQLRKDLEVNEDYGLVLIKIDNFSTINNFYGFLISDYVIEKVSKFLKETIKSEKVYRLSGSEFAFTLKENLNFYDLKIYLNNIYESIKSFSVMYQNSKLFVDFTIASTASSENKNIFSKVSMALCHAIDNGLSIWIYEDIMNFENDYERNLELSEVVRESVENSNIVPYFQAILDNSSGKIVKYECLARLIDFNGNVLSPLLFIPIAKKIKVYNEITKQIIDKSFATFENTTLEFSINLSIEDVMSSEIFRFIINKLKYSEASSRVTFEILESESINDFKKVSRLITEVKRYGAKIAIDDFGSGYSNFSYLIKIKANYIKIDGSLIENIHIDKASLLVVETIVSFAKKLGMKTVAEYVHSSVVLDKVKELGIDYSQGFFIDEPSIKRSTILFEYEHE